MNLIYILADNYQYLGRFMNYDPPQIASSSVGRLMQV